MHISNLHQKIRPKSKMGNSCTTKFTIVLLFLTILFLAKCPVYAQIQGFEEDTAVYVDAPPVVDAAGPQFGPGGTTPYIDQFQTGFLNLEFTSPLYFQFSGNTIFESGNLPNSSLMDGSVNFAWNRIMPFEFKYIPGVAFGADFMYFTSTSTDAYAGSESVSGPIIDLDLFAIGVNGRVYFTDPFKPLLHPYIGLGWGIILGHINTLTNTDGRTYSTSLSGFQAYRSLGVEVQIGDQGGLMIEFRTQSAYVATSNDPFQQAASGSSLKLDLEGVMIGLSGTYRF